jgi:hypothetical protein
MQPVRGGLDAVPALGAEEAGEHGAMREPTPPSDRTRVSDAGLLRCR